MGIFNNFDSILDLLGNSGQQDMEAIANKTGIDKSKTGAIIGMALPIILNQLTKNNQSETGLDSFTKAIQDHAQGSDYNSVSEYAENVDQQDADKMLTHVFEGKKDGIIERIADAIGIEPAAVKRVLLLIAPLVIKHIAGNAKNKDLDKGGIQKETEDIRDQVTGSLREFGKKRQETVPTPQQAPQESNGGSMLDDILGGLLGHGDQTPQQGQVPEQAQPQQQNGGLLDTILNNLL